MYPFAAAENGVRNANSPLIAQTASARRVFAEIRAYRRDVAYTARALLGPPEKPGGPNSLFINVNSTEVEKTMTSTQYLIVRLGPSVLPIVERYLSDDDRLARSNAGTSYTVKIALGRELVGIVDDLEAQAGQAGPQGRAASRAAKRALVRIGQAAQKHPDASVRRFESRIETWLEKMSPADRQDMVSRRDRSPGGRRSAEKSSPVVPKVSPALLLETDLAAGRLAKEARAMMTRFGYSGEEVVRILKDRLNSST